VKRHPLRIITTSAVTLCIALVPALSSCSSSSPDPQDPYKVTVAGDSISVGLGASLRKAVPDDVTTKVIGVEGSGLARPTKFDWPNRLETLAKERPPTVLVLSVGSNDAQDLTDSEGNTVASFNDSAAWDAEYSARLARSIDAFKDTDTTVLWVGHVRTEDETVGATNRRIHRLAAQLATTRPFMKVADLGALLNSGENVATNCLVPDGLHLKVSCLDDAAAQLVSELPQRQ